MKSGSAHARPAQRDAGRMGGPGFRAKKRLGQHFLVEPEVINKIVGLAVFQRSDLVLEIGPGQGALTLPLARTVGQVVAVEKDPQLVHALQKPP